MNTKTNETETRATRTITYDQDSRTEMENEIDKQGKQAWLEYCAVMYKLTMWAADSNIYPNLTLYFNSTEMEIGAAYNNKEKDRHYHIHAIQNQEQDKNSEINYTWSTHS